MKKETMILAGLGAVMALSLTEAVTSLAAEAGWTSVDGVWRYVDSSGNYVANVWKTSGSDSFYLGGDGVMETAAWIDDTYYVDESGAMVRNSWIQVTEEGGAKEPGWYYLNSSGKVEEDGDSNTYYFASSGSDKGAGYNGSQDGYLYHSGRLVKADSGSDYQIFEVDDKLYLVNESGKVQASSKSDKADGDYRYKIAGGAIYLIDDDQEVIREADSGDAQSLPGISYHDEYELR